MYTLLESSADIKQAQSTLETTIRREFNQTATRDIGWQGGRQSGATVYTDGIYWYWSADHKKDVTNPRRLNWFGRIGQNAGVEIAVEINTPYQGKNRYLAGFFARSNLNGKIYLFHTGRVGGGAEGVKKDALLAWANLEPQTVFAADGSTREAILVMPVSGISATSSAKSYVQDIVEFKRAVRLGETNTPEAKEQQRKLRKYFDEFSGRKTGSASAREIDYVSRHGEVVKALKSWRERKLIAGQSIVKDRLIDLGVAVSGKLTEIYEVKSSTGRGDVYTAIGQLIVHAETHKCTMTIVLPADPPMAADLHAALSRNNITHLKFRLTETAVKLL
jgi:hypothetical protein